MAVGDEVTVEVLDVDMDRERVSLSLKATQEDPWQHFARTHQIGQIVPGKVTKLVPFGSFVRVEEGIEGLVHISELAERHVEIPEQVVQVNDDVMVKIIDIDLERRRISLSLKQANETATASDVEEFDPTLYGMAATYDDAGQLRLPRRLRPRDGRVARGLRRAARGLGGAVRQGARPLGGARQAAGRGQAGRGRGRRGHVVLLRRGRQRRRRRPAAAPWPPTRPCRPCARSSPAAAPEPQPAQQRTTDPARCSHRVGARAAGSGSVDSAGRLRRATGCAGGRRAMAGGGRAGEGVAAQAAGDQPDAGRRGQDAGHGRPCRVGRCQEGHGSNHALRRDPATSGRNAMLR